MAESYQAGDPIARDDGRFYVPVSRIEPLDEVSSQIVLRVASDAFPDVARAMEFAALVVAAMNP